ncbi:MAG: hypothetical protein PW734_09215 [Verrucomicrobium sp.]|nr:hypothetical protein [Verrucomicrobium sp.]
MPTLLPPLPDHTEARLKGVLEKACVKTDSPEAKLVRHEVTVAALPDPVERAQFTSLHKEELVRQSKGEEINVARYVRAHNHALQAGLLDPRSHTH